MTLMTPLQISSVCAPARTRNYACNRSVRHKRHAVPPQSRAAAEIVDVVRAGVVRDIQIAVLTAYHAACGGAE
jgi:hypothetical protein